MGPLPCSNKSARPCFFAYNQQNYSWYLTAHYFELLVLKENYCGVYDKFLDGKFFSANIRQYI